MQHEIFQRNSLYDARTVGINSNKIEVSESISATSRLLHVDIDDILQSLFFLQNQFFAASVYMSPIQTIHVDPGTHSRNFPNNFSYPNSRPLSPRLPKSSSFHIPGTRDG